MHPCWWKKVFLWRRGYTKTKRKHASLWFSLFSSALSSQGLLLKWPLNVYGKYLMAHKWGMIYSVETVNRIFLGSFEFRVQVCDCTHSFISYLHATCSDYPPHLFSSRRLPSSRAVLVMHAGVSDVCDGFRIDSGCYSTTWCSDLWDEAGEEMQTEGGEISRGAVLGLFSSRIAQPMLTQPLAFPW